jgi:hypothetical protein
MAVVEAKDEVELPWASSGVSAATAAFLLRRRRTESMEAWKVR